MPLDPSAAEELREQNALAVPDLDAMPVRDALALLRTPRKRALPPPEETARIEDRHIAGPNGAVPVRLYHPPCGARGIFVYMHGGGWVAGSVAGDDVRCHRTACRAGVLVISVDYRLAPEHKFPAGLEDVYAIIAWAAREAHTFGCDPQKLGIGGTSAGGNLAAAAALLAKMRGGPALALQLLTNPICDASLNYPSFTENAQGPMLSTAMMAWFIGQYLADPAERSNPLVAPICAPDLSGLPPALIIAAECDPLRDEAKAYAERLRESGVETEYTCYEGVVHGFITRLPALTQARAAFEQMVRALRQHLG